GGGGCVWVSGLPGGVWGDWPAPLSWRVRPALPVPLLPKKRRFLRWGGGGRGWAQGGPAWGRGGRGGGGGWVWSRGGGAVARARALGRPSFRRPPSSRAPFRPSIPGPLPGRRRGRTRGRSSTSSPRIFLAQYPAAWGKSGKSG